MSEFTQNLTSQDQTPSQANPRQNLTIPDPTISQKSLKKWHFDQNWQKLLKSHILLKMLNFVKILKFDQFI